MIRIKTPEQIEGIRAAGKVVAEIHKRVQDKIAPGMSTYQIDNIARHTFRELKATSAVYKYSQAGKKGFPGYSCISVNEEVVHGIGTHSRILQEDDLVTIDVGATFDGFIGDAAFTVHLGDDPEIRRLNDVTRAALMDAIEMVSAGVFLFDICETIEQAAKAENLGVVTNYYGHGVGLELHEAPQIPNFRPKTGHNIKLVEGMTITFEPMFTLGSGEVEELEDDWTVVTKDRSFASHWEHTILVTEDGAEILTL